MKTTLTTLTLLLLLPCLLQANDFSGVKFLKISAAEQAVVIKDPGGKLQLLNIGDMVDTDTRIVAFEDDHVVLEGPGEWGATKFIVDVLAGQMHITRMARRPLEKYSFEKGEVKSFTTKSR